MEIIERINFIIYPRGSKYGGGIRFFIFYFFGHSSIRRVWYNILDFV
jgi:hypothetical protein